MAMHIDDTVRARKSEAEWREHVNVLQDAVCHLLRRNEELRNALRTVATQQASEIGSRPSDISGPNRRLA